MEHMQSQCIPGTYILVHGAWCWKKVIPLLEAKGHTVIALDLPSHGKDKTPPESVTLDDYVKKVVDASTAQQGKVILVGHSNGGITISQVAELLGPQMVDKLVYVDGILPQNGESVFSVVGKIQERNKALFPSTLDPSPQEIFRFSEDGKTSMWNLERVEQYLYHDCSAEDIAFAKANLSQQPVACLATPVNVTDSRYGIIPKFYILCTQAKDLNKSGMVTNVPCEKVYELSSSHSPFFSMPERLVELLDEVYHVHIASVSQ